jgi:hypothetical protein
MAVLLDAVDGNVLQQQCHHSAKKRVNGSPISATPEPSNRDYRVSGLVQIS